MNLGVMGVNGDEGVLELVAVVDVVGVRRIDWECPLQQHSCNTQTLTCHPVQ